MSVNLLIYYFTILITSQTFFWGLLALAVSWKDIIQAIFLKAILVTWPNRKLAINISISMQIVKVEILLYLKHYFLFFFTYENITTFVLRKQGHVIF